MKPLNLLNKKFGRLFVIALDKDKYKHNFWRCLCDCGNIVNVTSALLSKKIGDDYPYLWRKDNKSKILSVEFVEE
jgi:hypothetical protein